MGPLEQAFYWLKPVSTCLVAENSIDLAGAICTITIRAPVKIRRPIGFALPSSEVRSHVGRYIS